MVCGGGVRAVGHDDRSVPDYTHQHNNQNKLLSPTFGLHATDRRNPLPLNPVPNLPIEIPLLVTHRPGP